MQHSQKDRRTSSSTLLLEDGAPKWRRHVARLPGPLNKTLAEDQFAEAAMHKER